jgi:3-keto-L-gulonate-6-phosphate decarboxylase
MLNKGINKASLEDVKTENPALYNEIFESGKTAMQTEIATLKEENAKLKDQQTILAKAQALGLFSEGQKMVAEGKSLTEALTSLIDLKTAETGTVELKGVLQATAPAAVGSGSTGDEMSEEVTTVAQALKAVNPDGKLNKADAMKMARKQFSQVFVNLANGGK